MLINKANLKRMDVQLSALDYRKLFPCGIKEADPNDWYEQVLEGELDGAIVSELLIQLAGYTSKESALCSDFMEVYDLTYIEEVIEFAKGGRQTPKSVRAAMKETDRLLSVHASSDVIAYVFQDVLDGIQDLWSKKLFKLMQKIDKIYAKRLAKL